MPLTNPDNLLAVIAANDSHHDFDMKIKPIIGDYNAGIKGDYNEVLDYIDKNEAKTMTYTIVEHRPDNSNNSVSKRLLDDEIVMFQNTTLYTNNFDFKTRTGIDYEGVRITKEEMNMNAFSSGGEYDNFIMLLKSKLYKDSVLKNFSLKNTLFVHDASAINIYKFFKETSGEPFSIYFAHCPETMNDPATKPTFDTVAGYSGKNITFYSVKPNTRGDSVYNYILNNNDIYETEGRNLFNSTYQVKFTELSETKIKKDLVLTTDTTYSNLDTTGKKIFEHTYNVSTKNNGSESAINSVKTKINKLIAKGGNLNSNEVFNLNTAFQMKRGGDQLQVCFTKKIHDRLFEKKGILDFDIIDDGRILPTSVSTDLIKNGMIEDVYFVTHDQIAAALALLYGVNVIFTNGNTHTMSILKSKKTVDPNKIEENKYNKLKIVLKLSQLSSPNNLELLSVLDYIIKAIPSPSFTDALRTQTLAEIISSPLSPTLPPLPSPPPSLSLISINTFGFTSEKNSIVSFIDDYYTDLLRIIKDGVFEGKNKIHALIQNIANDMTTKKLKTHVISFITLIHKLTRLLNNYTMDLTDYYKSIATIDDTSNIYDYTIDTILSIFSKLDYYTSRNVVIQAKELPLLHYIYKKHLGGKTAVVKGVKDSKYDAYVGEFEQLFRNIMKSRSGISDNVMEIVIKHHFSLNRSISIVNPEDIQAQGAGATLIPKEKEFFDTVKEYFLLINVSIESIKQMASSNNLNNEIAIEFLVKFSKKFYDASINPGFETLVLQQGGGDDDMGANVTEKRSANDVNMINDTDEMGAYGTRAKRSKFMDDNVEVYANDVDMINEPFDMSANVEVYANDVDMIKDSFDEPLLSILNEHCLIATGYFLEGLKKGFFKSLEHYPFFDVDFHINQMKQLLVDFLREKKDEDIIRFINNLSIKPTLHMLIICITLSSLLSIYTNESDILTSLNILHKITSNDYKASNRTDYLLDVLKHVTKGEFFIDEDYTRDTTLENNYATRIVSDASLLEGRLISEQEQDEMKQRVLEQQPLGPYIFDLKEQLVGLLSNTLLKLSTELNPNTLQYIETILSIVDEINYNIVLLKEYKESSDERMVFFVALLNTLETDVSNFIENYTSNSLEQMSSLIDKLNTLNYAIVLTIDIEYTKNTFDKEYKILNGLNNDDRIKILKYLKCADVIEHFLFLLYGEDTDVSILPSDMMDNIKPLLTTYLGESITQYNIDFSSMTILTEIDKVKDLDEFYFDKQLNELLLSLKVPNYVSVSFDESSDKTGIIEKYASMYKIIDTYLDEIKDTTNVKDVLKQTTYSIPLSVTEYVNYSISNRLGQFASASSLENDAEPLSKRAKYKDNVSASSVGGKRNKLTRKNKKLIKHRKYQQTNKRKIKSKKCSKRYKKHTKKNRKHTKQTTRKKH